MIKTGYLSDVTRMATVYNYVRNGFFGLTHIMDVKDCDLGQVGDLVCEGATKEQIDKFFQLQRESSIVVYPTIDACPIPEVNAVDVILLPPFYLVKDRKIIYQ